MIVKNGYLIAKIKEDYPMIEDKVGTIVGLAQYQPTPNHQFQLCYVVQVDDNGGFYIPLIDVESGKYELVFK